MVVVLEVLVTLSKGPLKLQMYLSDDAFTHFGYYSKLPVASPAIHIA